MASLKWLLLPMFLIATGVRATVYTITATGAPERAFDNPSAFQGHLDYGSKVAMTFVFDDALMDPVEDTPTKRTLSGTFVSAFATVDGVSFGQDIIWTGTISKMIFPTGTYLSLLIQDYRNFHAYPDQDTTRYQNDMSLSVVQQQGPGSLAWDDPASIGGLQYPDAGAGFSFFTSDRATQTSLIASVVSLYSDTIEVGIQRASVVPEPATWAMFVAGVGLAGGAMRRRAGTRSSPSR